MRRFSRTALLALALALGGLGLTSPGIAFELPGLETILGVEDPLAVFPDTLPGQASLRLDFDGRDIYQYRRLDRLHRYTGWNAAGLGLVRTNFGWYGVRAGTSRLWMAQRDVYGMNDALDGGRVIDRLALAFGFRGKSWEVRGLAGRSSGPEGALEVRTSLGPIHLISARAWLWRSGTDFAQTIEGTTFFFPFEYRDESVELRIATKPLLNNRVAIDLKRQVIAGEKPHPDQYNQLFVSRWRVSGVIERTPGPLLDLSLFYDDSETDIIMVLDGTRFGNLRDIGLVRFGGEIGWKPWRRLRLAAGLDNWNISWDSKSYVDAWPFSVWDVFTSTRYRLEEMDKSYRVIYTRLGWTPAISRHVFVKLGGRFEWWRDSGTLHWKERVPVLPPFFFAFQHEEDSLDWPFTHGLQLDGEVGLRLGLGWELRVAGQAVVPLGSKSAGPDDLQADPDPDPDHALGPEPVERVGGGLRLRSSLRWTW